MATVVKQPQLDTPVFNSSMARQAVMNGNFDVWQRGISVAIPAGTTTYLADRWKDDLVPNGGTPPTLTRTREILTPGDIPGSFFYTRLTTNGAGSGFGTGAYEDIFQSIENGTRNLAGLNKKVTLSFWARSSITNKKIGVWLYQGYGTGGSPSTAEIINGTNWTLTSSWAKYTHTFTTNTLVGKTFGSLPDDALFPVIMNMWGSGSPATWVGATGAETFIGSGTIDIARIQLCAGEVALPFQPKSFVEELRDCKRFYEKSSDYSEFLGGGTPTRYGSVVYSSGVDTSNYKKINVYFQVQKRKDVTTLTTYDYAGNANKVTAIASDTSETNNQTGGVSDISENGFQAYYAGTTKSGFAFHWTAEAEL